MRTPELTHFSPTEFPLILAPMAGVSEAPFRQICRRLGADVVMSEFLSSEAIRRRIKTTLEGAEFEECERPIGIQIYGADAQAMAEATGLITEHYQPEFIDINFGCPVKKVVKRNGGSGCLRDLDNVGRIIRACVTATHLPVTVKTRSGWDEPSRDPVTIALRMQDAGAMAFTLHPRTRTSNPRRTSSACGATPGAPGSWLGAEPSAIPGCSAPPKPFWPESRSRQSRAHMSVFLWRWNTPGSRSACRGTRDGP